MDSLLVVFVVLVVVFLAVVSMVYIMRPNFLMNCDDAYPDVDMWLAFTFSLVVAIFTILVVWLVCASTKSFHREF